VTLRGPFDQKRFVVQRVLLKMLTAGLLPAPARHYLIRRPWRIEEGEAAGLKLGLPQNLEFVRGSSEMPVQRCIAGHLAPGSVFYDVGANIGFFSILAAKRVQRHGAVYAFEPLTENAAAIQRNASMNGLTNVSVSEVAVDETSGTGSLLLTDWDGGSSLSTALVAPSASVGQRAVRVIALDDLIESGGVRPPTLVKIDVEGAEFGVLRGMVRTIAAFKPALVYEVDDGDREAFHRRWEALDQFVSRLGYKVTHLENSYSHLDWNVGHSLAVPGMSA
jgi:FkbM family methyltransferase